MTNTNTTPFAERSDAEILSYYAEMERIESGRGSYARSAFAGGKETPAEKNKITVAKWEKYGKSRYYVKLDGKDAGYYDCGEQKFYLNTKMSEFHPAMRVAVESKI